MLEAFSGISGGSFAHLCHLLPDGLLLALLHLLVLEFSAPLISIQQHPRIKIELVDRRLKTLLAQQDFFVKRYQLIAMRSKRLEKRKLFEASLEQTLIQLRSIPLSL